jgi:DNA gyrase subunit A
MLMNGSPGIAVDMTTSIPPYNLGELIDTTCTIINNPDIPIGELCVIMRGPDLPTRGAVVGMESIKRYVSIRRGIMKMHRL